MENKIYISFKELVDMAAEYTGDSVELDCSIDIECPDGHLEAYAVSVAPCELLFFGKQGTATYVVDVYGRGDAILQKNFASLVDWDIDA